MASWFTLVAVLVADHAFGWRTGTDTTEVLVAIPALFRAVSWGLMALFRGWPAAWLGVAADLAFVWVLFDDSNPADEGDVLLVGLILAAAIPTSWGLSRRQWSFLPGVLGTACCLAGLWIATTRPSGNGGDRIVYLVLVGIACIWWTQLALIYWALRTWRTERTLS